jgi:hypothetical protein
MACFLFFFLPGTGDYTEVGRNAGVGATINVPLRGVRYGDWEYTRVWQYLLLPVADLFHPDLIVISAGFDATLNDPLGKMEVTPTCYAWLTRSLMEKCPRVVLALEGGYLVQAISDCFLACARALLGDAIKAPNMTYTRLSRNPDNFSQEQDIAQDESVQPITCPAHHTSIFVILIFLLPIAWISGPLCFFSPLSVVCFAVVTTTRVRTHLPAHIPSPISLPLVFPSG